MTVPSFPSSLPAFQRTFPDDAACRAHLATLRSLDAFVCPGCGYDAAWAIASRGLLTCRKCRRQVSLTSGSGLDRVRLPLSLVFLAAYLVATTPGMNSVTLARQLGIGRQGTAWLLLTKLRRAMRVALDTPLVGVVEADEAWFGGPQRKTVLGKPVRGQQRVGRTALQVLVLAEARKDGRVRLLRISDNGRDTLGRHIVEHVATGSTIRTDGWQPYRVVTGLGYAHDRQPHMPGWVKAGLRSTPYADEAISAAKRWILATYQKPPREHLDAYLAEFAFRREFRDPGVRFETLLRSLMAATPATRSTMKAGSHLPAVPFVPPHTPTKAQRQAARP